MGYRSRYEILASIVRSAAKEKGGLGLTKLMYISVLSYPQTLQFVKELVAQDLLAYESHNKKYKVTQKGMKFLSVVDSLEDLLNRNK